MLTLGAAVVTLAGVQAGIVGRSPERSYKPWPVLPPASATVDIGITTSPLARNSWRAWQPSDLQTVNAFEHGIHKHVSVVMWYADWAHSRPSRSQLEAVARRGSVPEVTWEPWDSVKPVTEQPRYRLRRVIEGRFDGYIREWARALAAYRRPVRLRFAHEMNGNWYPWSESANGNRPGEFVRAWRHVHGIFRDVGATNVQWVWSPAAITIAPGQYPGDRYVSMVSLSVFNGGSQLRYTRWRPLASLIRRSLKTLHAIAPDKQVELSEVGCGEKGGNKAAWIADMFSALPRVPQVTSVIWYDLRKGTDWRVATSRASVAAFRAGVADARYR
jgi:beta-mannanase